MSYLYLVWVLEKQKKVKNRIKVQQKIVNSTDVGSLLGTPMLQKKIHNDSDYHLTLNTRLTGSEATNKENQPTDEPRDSTQSGDNTS